MAVIEELLEAFKAQQQTIETLTVKLEETTAELEKAKARIAELEEQLHKDSHNSSKPPSTDGYEKPSPKSQRQKSGKKAGGQTGHKGHHMEFSNVDRVEQIYPKHCANCPHRENCTNLKVHNSCYVVNMEIKTTTVKYQMIANAQTNTLKIENIISHPTRSTETSATYYGGGIGFVEESNPAYVEFNGFKLDSAAGCTPGSSFGGLVGKGDKSFIVSNNVIISTSDAIKGVLTTRSLL